MNNELRSIINDDIKRGYDNRLFRKPIQLRYLITWRKASFYGKKHPLGIIYRFKLNKLSVVSGIQIPTETKIGKGLFIAHFGTIIVNPAVSIGSNVNIAPNVVIGKLHRGEKKGTPKIGDRVWIGAGSVIIGNINIGEDVIIAPNSYVNCDVPPHSIVIGNPGVIHHKDEATLGYINNMV